jgi:hypothetical protein
MVTRLYDNNNRSLAMQRLINDYSELIDGLVPKTLRRPSTEKRLVDILNSEGAILVTKFVQMQMPIIYYYQGFYYTVIPHNVMVAQRLPYSRKHNEITVRLNLLQYGCELTSKFDKAYKAITFTFDNVNDYSYIYKQWLLDRMANKDSLRWHIIKSKPETVTETTTSSN